MKKLLALVFVALTAVVARADFLYWMIDEESAGDYDFTKAVLKAADSTTTYSLTTVDGPISTIIEFQEGGLYYYSADLMGHIGEGYSYFVELMNGDDFVAKSAIATYTDISSHIFDPAGIGVPVSPMNFASYSVPEPTSGVLFLIGGVLLGLKRRRMV